VFPRFLGYTPGRLICRHIFNPGTTNVRRPGVQVSVAWVTERKHFREVKKMLWTIFVILLVLWLLGVVSSYTLGGFIHILLVIALVVLVLQLVSGRRAAL
jgi:hypothetical protein